MIKPRINYLLTVIYLFFLFFTQLTFERVFHFFQFFSGRGTSTCSPSECAAANMADRVNSLILCFFLIRPVLHEYSFSSKSLVNSPLDILIFLIFFCVFLFSNFSLPILVMTDVLLTLWQENRGKIEYH